MRPLPSLARPVPPYDRPDSSFCQAQPCSCSYTVHPDIRALVYRLLDQALPSAWTGLRQQTVNGVNGRRAQQPGFVSRPVVAIAATDAIAFTLCRTGRPTVPYNLGPCTSSRKHLHRRVRKPDRNSFPCLRPRTIFTIGSASRARLHFPSFQVARRIIPSPELTCSRAGRLSKRRMSTRDGAYRTW